MPLDLSKLKKRTLVESVERPKKKVDRFDGLSEEEVQRYTLQDYLETNLDMIIVGINPSLTAAHRGRYYAGPGNHFYKLLHESGLTPRLVSFEEDYKLLQYGIGLTNVVARATRSAADLKRTEIKEGARIVKEKLGLYKPRVAVFNGKGIYEVFANINSRSAFHFGLQPESIGDTAIWVTPSSSARCANFPRMVDKLHFYTGLNKYLRFLKGEIADVDIREFRFEGKCKQPVPSTSKMWRRKNISTFLHGGRVVNKNTLCKDTSEEDIGAVCTAEFTVHTYSQESSNSNTDMSFDKDKCSQENTDLTLFDEVSSKSECITKMERLVASGDSITMTTKSESCNIVVCDVSNEQNNTNCKNSKKHKSSRNKAPRVQNNLQRNDRDNSLDFINIIKQRLSQKS